jgi:hypothetical protein
VDTSSEVIEMITRSGALLAAMILTVMLAGPASAAGPANDEANAATPLSLGVPLEFNSAGATTAASDPTDCNGSHGP